MIKAFYVKGLPTRECKESVFWNWDNPGEGIRRFAVLGKEYTKKAHDIIVVIERATEALCNEEMDGQITDGYFEDVPYNCNFTVTYWNIEDTPNWILEVYKENMPEERTN